MDDRRYDERRSFGKRQDDRVDDRQTLEDRMEERRYLDDRRSEDRRFEDRRRFANERRQENSTSSTHRNEGRNYRQALLERFADMDFEDHHEYPDHQRYFE